MNGYTFAIITDMRRAEKLRTCLTSIHALEVPNFEVQMAVDYDHTGFLGALRNRACRRAKYDHLVVCDDDILFDRGFYQGLQQYGENYDVLVCKILNPDGTRCWDWATYGGPTGHHLLDYDELDDGFAYPPGGLVVLKKSVFDVIQWSETIGFYEGAAEDVEYGERLHGAGYKLKFNPLSSVLHDDPRYTQQGRIVVRRKDG